MESAGASIFGPGIMDVSGAQAARDILAWMLEEIKNLRADHVSITFFIEIAQDQTVYLVSEPGYGAGSYDVTDSLEIDWDDMVSMKSVIEDLYDPHDHWYNYYHNTHSEWWRVDERKLHIPTCARRKHKSTNLYRPECRGQRKADDGWKRRNRGKDTLMYGPPPPPR